MVEWMLRDVARAHDLRYVVLRYFNVAGADPLGRTGQATPDATHRNKGACEEETGKQRESEIFGPGHDTPDGTVLRDFIHDSDVASARGNALDNFRAPTQPQQLHYVE